MTPSIRIASALALLSLAGCDVLESEVKRFPEPRFYSVDPREEALPYNAVFCPDGRVQYTLGGDEGDQSTYDISASVIRIRGEDARFTLSPDEQNIVVQAGRTVLLVRRSSGTEFCGS